MVQNYYDPCTQGLQKAICAYSKCGVSINKRVGYVIIGGGDPKNKALFFCCTDCYYLHIQIEKERKIAENYIPHKHHGYPVMA